jgi:S-DNA-T family DNA segregation ATPase FtsK/SpoIIIE
MAAAGSGAGGDEALPEGLEDLLEALEPEILDPMRGEVYEVSEDDIVGEGPEVMEGVSVLDDEEMLGAIPEDPEPLEGASVKGTARPARRRKAYAMPSLDLLHIYDPPARRTREILLEDSRLLESKLADFSVKGRVTQVHPGPVVTMNEFEPAPGVKINRVVSLSDDLALALKVPSIRISAVPGASALGIEVPNPDRETVALREILGSDSVKKSDSLLGVALGKDIFGSPVVADLSRMPHLLVAGATGSGKSVFINSLVISLLYKARPDQVKMLMIDPKLLELSVYDGIPHLVSPVVTNPKDASEMLKRMVFEMERRYRILADRGVRNIEGYNEDVPPEEKMPYIVIFIDELADLMLASSAQVEDSIARLAQMARASGIHLVIATQRPSVDVITGVIKANFPARVAFQVTSKVDSRTIIDTHGAEQLIGRGDMLFMLPGKRLMRVHGALVTEAEVKAIQGHVSAQGEPDYSIMQAITAAEQEAKAEAEYSEDRDELFWNAVGHAEALGEVSISSIQRKLKVGYNRAARIMELMEQDGMVGPPKGAGKPRDFLGRNMPSLTGIQPCPACNISVHEENIFWTPYISEFLLQRGKGVFSAYCQEAGTVCVLCYMR